MIELPILRDLGLAVGAAAALMLVARLFRLPPILGYLVAGLLLGPVSGLVESTESVDLISEVGVALLLFLVGLELSLQRIRDVGRVAALGGVVQVALTTLLAGGLALAFGFGAREAGFIGLALAFSSTVVVVKLLDRGGNLGSLHGRIAIGFLLVQDILVAVTLTLLTGIGTEAGGPASAALLRGLGSAFGGIMALAAVAYVAVRWLLPRLLGWLSVAPEALFIVALTWCFLFILGAELLHLSVELGAFLAGIALAQLRFNDELRRRVHPLVNFFLAVFFVSLGLRMEPGAAAENWLAVITLSLFVVLCKPLIVAVLVPRFGYGARPAVLAGITLGQISEFSFVLATLGLTAGLIGPDVLSLIGAVGLLTIGASAVLVPWGEPVFRALESRGALAFLRASEVAVPEAEPELAGHIVVVGMNTLGRRLVREFTARGEHVLAVDTDARKLQDLPGESLLGSVEHGSVMEAAGVARARLVVSALQIEDVNNLLAYRCRRLGVPVSIHAFDPALVHELEEIGADHLMVSKHDGIRQVAGALRQLGVLE